LTDPSSPDDAWSGERFVPSLRGDIALEHLHRYAFACELVSGARVLDVASGEGYGSALLSRVAASVVGVDRDLATIEAARAEYRSANLDYRLGDCCAIPMEDRAVDTVVSFETIEHLEDHESFLLEVRRVLRTAGLFVVSSPDRESLDFVRQKEDVSSPFHVKELTELELSHLLARHFANVVIARQGIFHGSIVFSSGRRPPSIFRWTGAGLVEAPGLFRAPYVIALCSDGPLPSAGVSLLEGDDSERSTSLERSFALILEDRRSAQAIMDAQADEIRRLREDFTALREDRDEAQRVMDQQASELDRLRSHDATLTTREAPSRQSDR
jgi:O-antigen biosynthesis protein